MALLVLVVVIQFGYPVTQYGRLWSGIYVATYVGMLVFGLFTARGELRPVAPVAAAAVAATGFGVWGVLSPGDTAATFAMYSSIGLFLLVLILALLRFVFEERGVSALDLVLGAVCVYFLLGSLFTGLYGIVETLEPGSVVDTVHEGEPVEWQQLLYYSYVTQATLGYGEIVPVTPWARSLAILHTVIGVLYLAVVIARLVGSYSGTRLTRRPEQAEQTPVHHPGQSGQPDLSKQTDAVR